MWSAIPRRALAHVFAGAEGRVSEDFVRLADTDPEALIALMSGITDPTDLAFAALHLGESKYFRAAEILISLLNHREAIVREGAVTGLRRLEITNTIRFAILQYEEDQHATRK